MAKVEWIALPNITMGRDARNEIEGVTQELDGTGVKGISPNRKKKKRNLCFPSTPLVSGHLVARRG
jgi:hypothetical protein